MSPHSTKRNCVSPLRFMPPFILFLPYSLSERPAECGRIFYHTFVVPFLIRHFARFAKRIAGACRIKWTSYHSGRFDSARFKEDHAEPAAAYMKVSTTRRFPLIKKPEQLSRHSGEYPVQNQQAKMFYLNLASTASALAKISVRSPRTYVPTSSIACITVSSSRLP